MKVTMNKTLLAVAMTAALGVASTSAMAAFDPFQVTETLVPGASPNVINNAGKIIGNYIENVTFSGGASGNFTTSIRWNASDFVATDGSTSLKNQLGSFSSNQYGLYALISGSGTYAPGAIVGSTVFTFVQGGSLSAWIDPLSNTGFSGGTTVTGGSADDYQIAFGSIANGNGLGDPLSGGCGGVTQGINCGSFGVNANFFLTTVATPGVTGATPGTSYFTGPVPFYNMTLTSGQFDILSPGASPSTQSSHGSMDVAFTTVPEPASLALMGIGLMGLGVSLRRRKQA